MAGENFGAELGSLNFCEMNGGLLVAVVRVYEWGISMQTRRWLVMAALTLLGLAGCGTPTGGSPGPGQCKYKETGTEYASCQSDGDCFSGYCKASCKPGPCCSVATDSVRDQGRSYDCSTDSDCEAVAHDLISRGGKASCVHPLNVMVHHICNFTCPNQ